MEKRCAVCGAVFEGGARSQYCSSSCEHKAYYERGIEYYEPLQLTDLPVLYSFECASCGRQVNIYSALDRRVKYCCGKCAAKAAEYHKRINLAKSRYNHNLGMSGGMSMGTLIRREYKSAARERVQIVKTCPVCGCKFRAWREDKVCCSAGCSAAYRARRYRSGDDR